MALSEMVKKVHSIGPSILRPGQFKRPKNERRNGCTDAYRGIRADVEWRQQRRWPQQRRPEQQRGRRRRRVRGGQ